MAGGVGCAADGQRGFRIEYEPRVCGRCFRAAHQATHGACRDRRCRFVCRCPRRARRWECSDRVKEQRRELCAHGIAARRHRPNGRSPLGIYLCAVRRAPPLCPLTCPPCPLTCPPCPLTCPLCPVTRLPRNTRFCPFASAVLLRCEKPGSVSPSCDVNLQFRGGRSLESIASFARRAFRFEMLRVRERKLSDRVHLL